MNHYSKQIFTAPVYDHQQTHTGQRNVFVESLLILCSWNCQENRFVEGEQVSHRLLHPQESARTKVVHHACCGTIVCPKACTVAKSSLTKEIQENIDRRILDLLLRHTRLTGPVGEEILDDVVQPVGPGQRPLLRTSRHLLLYSANNNVNSGHLRPE